MSIRDVDAIYSFIIGSGFFGSSENQEGMSCVPAERFSKESLAKRSELCDLEEDSDLSLSFDIRVVCFFGVAKEMLGTDPTLKAVGVNDESSDPVIGCITVGC